MRKIGYQLFDIIWDVDALVDAEVDFSMNGTTETDFYKLTKKKLDVLAQSKFKLTHPFKDREIAVNLSQKYEAREAVIDEIIGRYGKFLPSKIHCSLMDIEKYLGRLSFELGVKNILFKDYSGEEIPDLLTKIGQEIDQLRKNGIDIGF